MIILHKGKYINTYMTKFVGQSSAENKELYGTLDNTFDDFPIGTKVKVITKCEDFTFFYGETGKVIRNSGQYLGICVRFDKPRHFKDGHVQTAFNFNPSSLYIDNKERKRIKKQKEKKELEEYQKQKSERFRLLYL